MRADLRYIFRLRVQRSVYIDLSEAFGEIGKGIVFRIVKRSQGVVQANYQRVGRSGPSIVLECLETFRLYFHSNCCLVLVLTQVIDMVVDSVKLRTEILNLSTQILYPSLQSMGYS